jgi:hypothetical protein
MVVDAIIGLVELFEYNSLFARQICRVESATKRQAYDLAYGAIMERNLRAATASNRNRGCAKFCFSRRLVE